VSSESLSPGGPVRGRGGLPFKVDPVLSSLVLLLVAVAVLFAIPLGERFVSLANLRSMALQMPELGILALAMMITLLSGGLNLAVVSTANLSALLMGYVLTAWMPAEASGLDIAGMTVVAVALGLALAAICGLISGVVIAYFGVSPILATLGTMILYKGIAIGFTRGGVVSGFPEPITFVANGAVFGIPMPLLVFFLCAIPVAVLLNRTPFGIGLYMIGSNEPATRYSGIDTKRLLVWTYTLSGLLCGVAGLVMMSRFNSANASYGESYLLVTILAAVLGGTDPFGGFGKVGGLVVALVILQVISSGFNLLGLSSHLALAIWGGILLLVMAISYIRARLGRTLN
jgi:simple sugar transport system permease protein